MMYESRARRVTLTTLLILWLSVQNLVIGLSPSWGFVLPHDHITRGYMSEAAWQAHLREHQLGALGALAVRCDVPQDTASPVLASIPDTGGALSFLADLGANVHDGQYMFEMPFSPPRPLGAATFTTVDITYAPLDPPPTA